MENNGGDLIIDGNSVYEIDRNCEAKLKSLNNKNTQKKHEIDFISLLVLMLVLDL